MIITKNRLKERNIELAKTVDELQRYINTELKANIEQKKQVEQIIESLEKINIEWIEEIQELQQTKNKYNELIKETNAIRKLLLSNNLRLHISIRDKIKLFCISHKVVKQKK